MSSFPLEDELLDMLYALDGMEQNPKYHPEGDALYHSLQVFAHSLESTDDPELWAAALLHDIGKAEGCPGHAERGAQWLEGLVSERIVELVRHHMDLHRQPQRTRHRWRGTTFLRELEQLRQWDKAGRDPHADVMAPEEAVQIVVEELFLQPPSNGSAVTYHEAKEYL